MPAVASDISSHQVESKRGDLIPRVTLLFLAAFYASVMVLLLRRAAFLFDLGPLVLLILLVEWRGRR